MQIKRSFLQIFLTFINPPIFLKLKSSIFPLKQNFLNLAWRTKKNECKWFKLRSWKKKISSRVKLLPLGCSRKRLRLNYTWWRKLTVLFFQPAPILGSWILSPKEISLNKILNYSFSIKFTAMRLCSVVSGTNNSTAKMVLATGIAIKIIIPIEKCQQIKNTNGSRLPSDRSQR